MAETSNTADLETPPVSGNEERANVATPTPATPEVSNLPQCPPHNTFQLLNWLQTGQNDLISQHFVRVLEYLDKKLYVQLGPAAKYYVSRVAQDFLYIMAQPEYILSPRFAQRFVELNTVIANAVAISPFETTDHCLDMVCNAKQSKDNSAKVCALYSARNRKRIDRKKIVDANPLLASLWYSSYMGSYTTALADGECLERMREHIMFADDRLDLTMGHAAAVYYGATYVDHRQDRHVKRRINESFQKKDAGIVFTHQTRTSEKPKIAVISDLWRQNHSACRIQFQFLAALKGHYHMTLLHALYKDTKMFDMSLFDDSIYIGDGRGGVDVTPILKNDFDIAYFPDVGMTDPSIRLSNMRIAPIQVCGLGHSVSTFGSRIDYYVSGKDVELPTGAEDNYSEKLILLPGFGAIHNQITYQIQGRPVSQNPIVVNCPWSPQKTNYTMLRLLNRIRERANRRVVFRFFPLNYSVRQCGHARFMRDVQMAVGEDSVDLRPGLNYSDYMSLMEEGHVCADAFPFGGCNTVADAMYLRKPIVCLEGASWYNRIGPAMLRSAGLSSLVAANETQYVDKLVELINQEEVFHSMSKQLNDVNLDATIFSCSIYSTLKDSFDRLLGLENSVTDH